MSKIIVKEEEAREKQELSRESRESRIPGLDGEWSNDDVSIPRLQVVAKTSDLVDEGFEPGSLVLSKEVTVAKKDEVVDIIVVNMLKRYRSEVDFESGEEAEMFHTLAEAEAAGFSLDWESENRVRPMADLTLMIAAPKGMDKGEVEAYFPYAGPDKRRYAMALMTAQKTAFKSAAGPVVTYLRTSGADLLSAGFTLRSVLKTMGKNSWWAPIVKRGEKLDAKMVAFVKGVMGS